MPLSRIKNYLYFFGIVAVGVLTKIILQASWADGAVLSWAVFVLVFQKEGIATLLAGIVIGAVNTLLKLFRPELVVNHLSLYAWGMITIGVVGYLAEHYDIFSKEFWATVHDRTKHITWSWVWGLLCKYWNSIPLNIRIKSFLMALVFVVLLIFTTIHVFSALVWVFFLGSCMFSWSSRISFGLSAVGLVIMLILLVAHKQPIAAIAAAYSYSFLCIGIVREAVILPRRG